MANPTAAQVSAGYNARVAGIRAALLAVLVGLWKALPDYRGPAAAKFIAQTAPLIAGAQLQVAQLTAAYLAAVTGGQLGRTVPAVPVRPADVANLRGVAPSVLYQRPFTQVYTELSRGVPIDTAVDRGRIRLVDLATTDVQLAKTHTARRALAAEPAIAGYRRVLVGEENCGLCVVASTQLYHREELLPIHPGCDCSVEPVHGEHTGQVLDKDVLAAAHAAIAERFGKFDAGGRAPDYRKVILVRQHGEIGPVLTVKGQEFTGPGDLTGSGS